jgi:hypothetical protein
MGKKSIQQSATGRRSTAKNNGQPAGNSGFSGEERRAALAAISSAEWERIRTSRFAAISIDEQRILAHGNDSLEVADSAAQTNQRYVVVANRDYNASGPRKSDRSVA